MVSTLSQCGTGDRSPGLKSRLGSSPVVWAWDLWAGKYCWICRSQIPGQASQFEKCLGRRARYLQTYHCLLNDSHPPRWAPIFLSNKMGTRWWICLSYGQLLQLWWGPVGQGNLNLQPGPTAVLLTGTTTQLSLSTTQQTTSTTLLSGCASIQVGASIQPSLLAT